MPTLVEFGLAFFMAALFSMFIGTFCEFWFERRRSRRLYDPDKSMAIAVYSGIGAFIAIIAATIFGF